MKSVREITLQFFHALCFKEFYSNSPYIHINLGTQIASLILCSPASERPCRTGAIAQAAPQHILARPVPPRITRGRRHSKPTAMKILFISATRVGDAVLSTGLLSHLIGQYPKARITIAAGPAALSLFEAVPNLEELISMEKSILERHWFELWRRCFGTRWDIVVDLRRSAIAWLLHSGKRYRIPKLNGAVHRVELLGATLGLRDNPPAPTLWTNRRHKEAAKRLLTPGTPVLAIAPVANWRGKQWRAERFAELAVRLTRPDGLLPGARVAVFASEHERPQALPVLSALPEDRVIDTIGKIDLPTVAACLHRCALFIGNDSGLMHMAAASDVPTLGLFGPSRTEHYAP